MEMTRHCIAGKNERILSLNERMNCANLIVCWPGLGSRTGRDSCVLFSAANSLLIFFSPINFMQSVTTLWTRLLLIDRTLLICVAQIDFLPFLIRSL